MPAAAGLRASSDCTGCKLQGLALFGDAVLGRHRRVCATIVYADRRIRLASALRHSLLYATLVDRRLERLGDLAGDVVLDHQLVLPGSIVGFRPDNEPVVGTNQSRRDAQRDA